MKAYIKVDVTKGLPLESGEYFILLKDGSKNADKYYSLEKKWGFWNPTAITHWLKEIDLSGLMIEFARWAPEYMVKGHSMKSALPIFLKSKGILTIE